MTFVGPGASGSVFAVGDRREPKVADACIFRAIYQDIWLGNGQRRARDTTLLCEYNTYALQIPVDHMAGVEVVETLSHIQELREIQFS